MGNSQDIYQQYLSKPEMLGAQLSEEYKSGDHKAAENRKRIEELSKQVAVLTTSVENMYLQVERAKNAAGKARRIAWIAIVIAIAASAGIIAENINMWKAFLR